MYSPRIVSVLNAIAHKYSELIRRAVEDVLTQPRYSNTGAGADSVRVEVVEGNENSSPQLNITFADHLIMLNKSKMQWTRLPNMNKLIAWANTKKSDDKEAIQLAWATAWNQKRFDTWKPKLWRKKSLSHVLKEMNEQLLKEYDAAIEADIAASLVLKR